MKRTKRTKQNRVRLMLDSGAYTAWTKGEAIDLKEYIAYIKKNSEYIDTYFNLDVIPGRQGQKRTPKIIEEGAAASYKNLQLMKKAGLTPIPVFHQQEDPKWLRKMIDGGEPYIALSTFKELSIKDNVNWLDECFSLLTDKEGKPLRKVHGLGVASFELLKQYPWYTCDATSWALTAAYGAVFVPQYRGGKPDFSLEPIKLTVSTVDRKNGVPADHYLRYGPIMRERVEDFLENYVKVSTEDVAEDYVPRAQAIVYFMLRFQEAIGDVRFKRRVRRFAA